MALVQRPAGATLGGGHWLSLRASTGVGGERGELTRMRSNADGLPPRWTWPRIVTRVSYFSRRCTSCGGGQVRGQRSASRRPTSTHDSRLSGQHEYNSTPIRTYSYIVRVASMTDRSEFRGLPEPADLRPVRRPA